MSEIENPGEGALSEWTVKIEEVSAGVYRPHAYDQAGRRFGMTGIDPDALLEECRKCVAQLTNEASRS